MYLRKYIYLQAKIRGVGYDGTEEAYSRFQYVPFLDVGPQDDRPGPPPPPPATHPPSTRGQRVEPDLRVAGGGGFTANVASGLCAA